MKQRTGSMDFFNLFGLTEVQWILVLLAAFMVGFSKTGVSGMIMLVIPLLASGFGGMESTGVLLPLLVAGDFFAVWYYHRHAQWRNIRKLLPWAFVGLLAGMVVGNLINDAQFKALIGFLVIVCLGILVYTERKGSGMEIPENPWLFALTGVAAGFASMIGNAAGPIFSVYLLARGFKKYDFMGTSAWFFLLINLSKVPLQVFVWHNVTTKSFLLALLLLPAIALGAFLGSVVIKKINEKIFRYVIIALTAVAAFRLFI